MIRRNNPSSRGGLQLRTQVLTGPGGVTPSPFIPNSTALEYKYEAATGSPTNTVVRWGSALEKGAVYSGDTVGLRNRATTTLRAFQLEPMTYWEDGSIRTFHAAHESETGSDGTFTTYDIVAGSAAAAGSTLSWATQLTGRTISMTVTPASGQGTAWTWDIKAAILASTDDKAVGPLVCERLAVSAVPSANFNGKTSLRAKAYVHIYKDGSIGVRPVLANDGFFAAGGGDGSVAWTVSVDGATIYTQATARLPQYSVWSPHHLPRYKANAAAVAVGDIKPNMLALHLAGVTNNYQTDTTLSTPAIDIVAPDIGVKESDPYHSWGMDRYAPNVGGRPEIGPRTNFQMAWLVTGSRTARTLSLAMARAAMTRSYHMYDAGLGRIPTVQDFSAFWGPNTDNSGFSTARNLVGGWPNGQRPLIGPDGLISGDSNFLGIGTDHAHNGAYHALPALLTCDWALYDALAHRVAWAPLDQVRQPATLGASSGSESGLTPNENTGVNWIFREGYAQLRSQLWYLRDAHDADSLLPYNYPNRAFYTKNLNVNFNWLAAYETQLKAAHGVLYYAPNSAGYVIFQISFGIWMLALLAKNGLGGNNVRKYTEALLAFRAEQYRRPDWRATASGMDSRIGDNVDQWWTTWAQYDEMRVDPTGTVPIRVAADWTGSGGEGDWQRNAINSALIAAEDPALPVSLRAALMDAVVRTYSERWNSNVGSAPRLADDQWGQSNAQLNDITPPGKSWIKTAARAPVVRAKSYLAKAGVTGEVVALLEFDGNIPRASAADGTNAFTIVSASSGAFTVTRGGGIVPTTAMVNGNTYTLSVYARCYDDDGVTLRQGPTATVTLLARTVPAVKPIIAVQTLALPANADNGDALGPVALVQGVATSWSILRNAGPFTINASGQLVKGAGTLTQGQTYSPVVRATNEAGSHDRIVTLAVGAAVNAPVFANQTFSRSGTIASGATVGTVTATGDVTGWSIVSGNGSGFYAINASTGVITATTTLTNANAASTALVVRATNQTKFTDATVTIEIAAVAGYVYGATANGMTYRAIAGLRRIRDNYSGPLVQVQKVSGGATQDIGLSGTEMDETALTTFAAGAECRVTRWYNQAESGGYFAADAGGFPTITTSAGAIIRGIGTGSKPAIQFDSTEHLFMDISMTGAQNQIGAIYSVEIKGYTPAGIHLRLGSADRTIDNGLPDYWTIIRDVNQTGDWITAQRNQGTRVQSAVMSVPDNTPRIIGAFYKPNETYMTANNTSTTVLTGGSTVNFPASRRLWISGEFLTDAGIHLNGLISEMVVLENWTPTQAAAAAANMVTRFGT